MPFVRARGTARVRVAPRTGAPRVSRSGV